MKRYKGKYRPDSLRLQGYDYSSEGLYFLTICTKNKRRFFGTVKEGIMKMNSAGRIVANEWEKTEKIRDRVQLGEWVVMPNHLHGIIYLKPKQCRDASHASQDKCQQSDGHSPSLHSIEDSNFKNEFGPQRNNISSIVRGFKSACSRKISELGKKTFSWQSGFYDHIIRNQKSLLKIERYIRENPYRWAEDRYYC